VTRRPAGLAGTGTGKPEIRRAGWDDFDLDAKAALSRVLSLETGTPQKDPTEEMEQVASGQSKFNP
jgi:hypothetical protein